MYSPVPQGIYTVHTHVRHGLSTLSAANIINACTCMQSTHTTHIHTARTSCYIYIYIDDIRHYVILSEMILKRVTVLLFITGG